MTNKLELQFGDIVWAEFAPSVAHRYQDKRLAVVIQSAKPLEKSRLVTVIPLSSLVEEKGEDDIMIFADLKNKLKQDAIAKVYCISSFDHSRFTKKIGSVSPKVSADIKKYLERHFGI
ncbi:MAG: mRNA interferase [Parcubacteria group bacterium Gr01-1014_18]|nr:MAG: mRNA interferase [Parcubacteria group bacterium Greene0416_36]TSC81435.1 MAG: mRNA interferase [Parcubacteria group bacterium Gr01-1014_18]TSC99033.1 MAG: mRNA interferase [Parcubacteria group bacterium Greene1014_20]TSD07286.1 MAG: mRNA interferase [Parcubacteria group bacterium Greene0714_2]